ncbi:hypothetical protein UUU_00410 [Klebsiella pneumoniae subsp. pneumoniae DSM 30104 = JCM 1662 = NBRC 14940]|nr:hypothetical protein UUU_00410 [Klebsiella pneumoniae subsp. pneumoniae DSM 30104 = JCM 1662 = NBRC 14940]
MTLIQASWRINKHPGKKGRYYSIKIHHRRIVRRASPLT